MFSQELPPHQRSSDGAPQVPSSDAVLPSSPSPVKKTEVLQNGEVDKPLNDGKAETKLEQSNDGNAQIVADKDTTVTGNTPVNPPTNPHLSALHQKHTTLTAKLAALHSQRQSHIDAATLPSGLPMPPDWTEEQKSKQALATANGVIKEHIALLHSYNEIKDVGMGLMGLVADKRGVRVKAIMEEFGMSEKD